MTRKQQRIFQKANRLLQYATPLRTDCGVLCDKSCCKGDDETGMLLFPNEPTTLRVLQNGSRRVAVCGGSCDRNARPLGCRLFPFFPFCNSDGSIRVAMDPRGEAICPLVRVQADVLFSHRFLHRVRRAGELLCRDEQCRAFLRETQGEIEQQQALLRQFSGK